MKLNFELNCQVIARVKEPNQMLQPSILQTGANARRSRRLKERFLIQNQSQKINGKELPHQVL